MRMTLLSKFVILSVLALGSLHVTSSVGAADPYPSRPVRLIVPYPPGGPTDLTARVYAERLATRLGQPVIIENRPGAAGAIGLEAAAKSSADGYTLVLGTASTHAVNPQIRPQPYDARKDFAPVSLISDAPIVLSANPDLPVKSIRELIDYSLKKPDELNFGSDGQGSLTHLAGELLKAMTGLKMQHIAYKGTAQAVNAVVSGELHLSMTGALNAIGLAGDNKLRVLAVGGATRLPQLPSVPTMAEAGVAGYDVASWFAIFAPAKTDPAIVDRLSREIREIAAMPEVAGRLAASGGVPRSSTPDGLGALIADESEKWSKLIRDARITAE